MPSNAFETVAISIMTADGKHDSLDEVEPLLAEGGLGPPAGLDTMRPNTGASVVAPAAIMDRTQPLLSIDWLII